jgi:hypothetical protein
LAAKRRIWVWVVGSALGVAVLLVATIAWDLGHAWLAAVALLLGVQVIALRALLTTPNRTGEVSANRVL